MTREDTASLAELRLIPGIEIGERGGVIWLRGKHCDDLLDAKLRALPVRGKYEWIAPNNLRAINQRIPVTHLPEVNWQPLNAWLQVEIPVAAIPANGPSRVSMHLVRSTDEREPELLLTTLPSLEHFAATAARVRLDRLQFAANTDRLIFVRGMPLPPMTGRRFVIHGCVAVPAGFSWEPAVNADVVARAFGASGEMLLVWHEDGTVTRLQGEQFVPLTRSAITATMEALAASP